MPDISTVSSLSTSSVDLSIPLITHLIAIRDGEWQDLIFDLRNTVDEEVRKKKKFLLPGAIYSGVFSKRNDLSIIQHSGLLCMDYDGNGYEDIDNLKTILCQDKYVYACWISPSGTGLRILFRINGTKHRISYLSISEYLLDTYGIICDTQCINVSRSFHVSFDPYLYLSEVEVPVFNLLIKEKVIKKVENVAFSDSDFENIINQISAKNINLCEDYESWLKIGFSFAHKFGESGREYFHCVSQCSSKYSYASADKQYTYCIRHKGDNVATISTFYYYCKNAGIQITSERTNKIRKATITGKNAGLKKEQIVENLKKFENIENCDKIVEEIFNSANDLTDGDGLVDQLEIFITTNYSLLRNEITRTVENSGVQMGQNDLNTIYISAKRMMAKLNYELLDRLILSDFVKSYNPITKFFEETYPEYADIKRIEFSDNCDFETPLIDKFCSSIINDNPQFTRYFIKKWLVGVVSAAYKMPSPLVLVLIGKILGTGKTEWFRRLLPDELKKYYAESKLDAGKDDDILMTQKLIIMDDEFSGKSKKEEGKLKMLTSKEWFSLREPYGRINVDLRRLAVLGGTSNINQILSDPFGNRRIIPIQVNAMDRVVYNSVNKKDLWGEIYGLWKHGFDWRVDSQSDKEYLNSNSYEYETTIVEAELISKYYEPFEGTGAEHMTSTDIKVELESISKQILRIDQIGKQLTKLNFVQKTVREGVKTSKKWFVIKINRPNSITPF